MSEQDTAQKTRQAVIQLQENPHMTEREMLQVINDTEITPTAASYILAGLRVLITLTDGSVLEVEEKPIPTVFQQLENFSLEDLFNE